ncbi:unnamed protein product [Discosporangium mesarthrocarpum]
MSCHQLTLLLVLCAVLFWGQSKAQEERRSRRLSTKIKKTKMLEQHNIVRCMHGSAPLKWNRKLARQAKRYAKHLASTQCGKLDHSAALDYGENLYYCGAYGGSVDPDSPCYNPEEVMHSWYDEEVSYLGGHMTQVVWDETTKLGCGRDSCSKNGWHYDMIVCQYKVKGNNGDASQVKDIVKSREQCE